jgi:ubiquinone biosynthesis protein
MARLTVQDKTSGHRAHEIVHILHKHQLSKGLSPQKLKGTLEDLGPTFVKMGQILSTRSDMLPREYCTELATLHAHVAPLDFSQVIAVIEEAYGDSWQSVFSQINKQPLGSASIAQVHKASLRHGGQVVAVKIQRPGIAKKMAEDLMLMRHVLATYEVFKEQGATLQIFSEVINELEKTAADELDFGVELNNLVEFRQCNTNAVIAGAAGGTVAVSAGSGDTARITCPTVYPQYSKHSILVMEFIDGILIDDLDGLAGTNCDLGQLSTVLTHNYVHQILSSGFFHADPHAGNILVRNDALVWIDLGMTGRLNASERALCQELFVGIAAGSSERVKTALLTLSSTTGPVSHPQLLAAIDGILAHYASRSLGELNLSAALTDLLEMIRTQNLKVPAAFTLLARGLITFEGVIQVINPSLNVVAVIGEYAKTNLRDDFSLSKIKENVEKASLTALDASEAALRLPRQTSELLTMASRGQLEATFNVKGLDDVKKSMARLINRLALSLISAALFIGSSILCATDMNPQAFNVPLLGILGYMGAFMLSIWVIVGIIRNKS